MESTKAEFRIHCGKHKGKDVSELHDASLPGMVYSHMVKNPRLSDACKREMIDRFGHEASEEMMAKHNKLLLTDGFEPRSLKDASSFLRCALCNNPCERIVGDGMCPSCEPYDPHSDNKHRRTQQRIVSYFNIGLNLVVVAEGRYRCDTYPEIRVTASGSWQVGEKTGKGIVSLRSVLKRIGYRMVKNRYLNTRVISGAESQS